MCSVCESELAKSRLLFIAFERYLTSLYLNPKVVPYHDNRLREIIHTVCERFIIDLGLKVKWFRWWVYGLIIWWGLFTHCVHKLFSECLELISNLSKMNSFLCHVQNFRSQLKVVELIEQYCLWIKPLFLLGIEILIKW